MRRVDEIRYLVSFDLGKLPVVMADVCVIGTGAAGLSAAITAAGEGARAVVISKDEVRECNTFYAQGGVAAVLGGEDSVEEHTRDTLAAGHGLCSEEHVKKVVAAGADAVKWLIGLGADFDTDDGGYALAREGGHSRARILRSGDATGQEIEKTLIRAASSNEKITFMENTFAVEIVTAEGTAVGVLVIGAAGMQFITARAVILATGGSGCVYRETTNPSVATGDGVALAFRAGAKLVDLEFFQFHPTTLYIAGADRFLISEAVRGEGGILRNRDGKRFMPEYAEAAELAPRDVVSRAIVDQMKKTGSSSVYLDLSHLRPDFVRERFPTITRIVSTFDLDIAKDPIPVRPSAHYFVGGVSVDETGRTSVERLYAAGECASSGFHGANRLGSNSLLEALVFGRASAQAAAAEPEADIDFSRIRYARKVSDRQVRIMDVTNSLRALMWKNVGIIRSSQGLVEAVRSIEYWSSYVLDMEFRGLECWELQNMIVTSIGIAASALKREESRGVHYRSDFPSLDDDNFRRRIFYHRKGQDIF